MSYPIHELHIELTSKCNARCPLCPRQLAGTLIESPNLPHGELSPKQLDHILSDESFYLVRRILINGNYGDFLMHDSPLDVLEVIRNRFPRAALTIHTNGGARSVEFWKQLTKYNPTIEFAIDGLEDTHHLYRRNTSYDVVIKNARAFIDAGGNAIWKMIGFQHNQHQIEDCRSRAAEWRFKHFVYFDSTRSPSNQPVFDKNMEVVNFVRSPRDASMLSDDSNRVVSTMRTIREITDNEIITQSEINERDRWIQRFQDESVGITCDAKHKSSIFIDRHGAVYPCCWLGHGDADRRRLSFQKYVSILKSVGMDYDDTNLLNYRFREIVAQGYFAALNDSFKSATPHTDCIKHCGGGRMGIKC